MQCSQWKQEEITELLKRHSKIGVIHSIHQNQVDEEIQITGQCSNR